MFGLLSYPLYDINVTFLDLDIASLDGPSESGFICTGIDCVINHLIGVLRLAYADVVMPVTRGGLSSTVATALNNLLSKLIHNSTDLLASSAMTGATAHEQLSFAASTVEAALGTSALRVLEGITTVLPPAPVPAPQPSVDQARKHSILLETDDDDDASVNVEVVSNSSGQRRELRNKASSWDKNDDSDMGGGAQCTTPAPLPFPVPETDFVDLRQWVFLNDLSKGLQFLIDDYYNGLIEFVTCGTGALNLSSNLSFHMGPNFNKYVQ